MLVGGGGGGDVWKGSTTCAAQHASRDCAPRRGRESEMMRRWWDATTTIAFRSENGAVHDSMRSARAKLGVAATAAIEG